MELSEPPEHGSEGDELEQLYELLYLLPVGIVAFDSTGSISRTTPLSIQLMGPFVPMPDVGNAFALLAPIVPDLAELIAADEDAMSVLTKRRSTLEANGSITTVEVSIQRPRPDYYIAVLSDATELVQRENELEHERDRLRLLVDVVSEFAIYTIDLAGFVDSWNASGERLFGLTKEQAIGQRLDQLVGVRGVSDVLASSVLAGWNSIEGWALQSVGHAVYTNTMISTLLDARGRPEGFIVVTQDSTEAKHHEEDLQREADTDPLTQLRNRRGFDARADRQLAACVDNDAPATVLMIDIDRFKSINDTHGHDGGDIVLRAVAESLADHIRTDDVVARFGGEEFVVLLPGADLTDATSRAEALRAAIDGLTVEVEPGLIAHVTISIGVAEFDGSLDEALHRADAALYVAKDNGRNQVVSDGA